jgi:hypothetical protein
MLLDLVNYAVAQGHTLIEATLLDDTSAISLPLAVFDGQPIQPVLDQLRRDWQAALTPAPIPREPHGPAYPPPYPASVTHLHCILYFSAVVEPIGSVGLAALLEQSRLYNHKAHITGVLFYTQGGFIQVLEGEKEAVEALFYRIKQDARHTGVTLVLNAPLPKRQFAKWTMGFEGLTSGVFEELKSQADAIPQPASLEEPLGNNLLQTVQAFFQTNHLK